MLQRSAPVESAPQLEQKSFVALHRFNVIPAIVLCSGATGICPRLLAWRVGEPDSVAPIRLGNDFEIPGATSNHTSSDYDPEAGLLP